VGNLAQYLDTAMQAAGVPIIGVSVGHASDRSTWTVQPASLQAQAQPIIDAFVMPTAAQLAEKAIDATSRQKDIMAMVAFALQAKDPVAWAATTPAQKRAAVLAGAGTWRSLRALVDSIA